MAVYRQPEGRDVDLGRDERSMIYRRCQGLSLPPSTIPRNGKRPFHHFLLTLILGQPDLTLDEVVCAMRKRKLSGSRTAVWRFFQRGWRFASRRWPTACSTPRYRRASSTCRPTHPSILL
jgi:hypothetical protein